MAGPTQRVMDRTTVERVIAASLGPGVLVGSAAPLTGGGFAAVWKVVLGDGRALVLKAAPPDAVPLLRYERGLIAAEADFFRLVRTGVPELPVPEVVSHGTDRAVLDGDWLLTTWLPGTPLPGWRAVHPDGDTRPARRALGSAVAGLSVLSSPRFGYSGDRPGGTSWPLAFGAIVESLLADAAAWRVDVPGGPARVRALLSTAHDVLADVARARLVHVDVWDGNVLVTSEPADPEVAVLSGLVDGERHLFGDPLVDLVSPALFRRIEDDRASAFLAGWAQRLGRPMLLGEREVVRLALYRVHLYLVMLVEMPSRGTPGDGDQRAMLETLLDEEIAYAEAALRG